MSKELEKQIRGIVAYQFDHVTNLTQPAYKDSLRIITKQIIPIIEQAEREQYHAQIAHLGHVHREITQRLVEEAKQAVYEEIMDFLKESDIFTMLSPKKREDAERLLGKNSG